MFQLNLVWGVFAPALMTLASLGQISWAQVSPAQVSSAQSRQDGAVGAQVRSSTPTAQQLGQWIEQLSSAEFTQRELATQQLLRAGRLALGQLKQATTRDAETRYRIDQLVSRLETEIFEDLSQSFLLDRDAEKSYGLSGWSHFRALAGSSRTSKLLFLEMIRRQPQLASLMEEVSQAADPSAARERLMRTAAAQARRLSEDRLRFQRTEIGDVVAILTSAALADQRAPIEINELLETSARIVPVTTFMNRRGYGNVLRRMYDAWLPKTHDSIAFSVLELSLQYRLASGADIARRHLSNNFDVSTREYAIHCLTCFGDRSDVPRLVELLDDETVCDEFLHGELPRFLRPHSIEESDESPPGVTEKEPQQASEVDLEDAIWQVRISDLALASILMLEDVDPGEVFPAFRKIEQFGFDSRSVAVRRSELSARRDVMRQWKSDYQQRGTDQ